MNTGIRTYTISNVSGNDNHYANWAMRDPPNKHTRDASGHYRAHTWSDKIRLSF